MFFGNPKPLIPHPALQYEFICLFFSLTDFNIQLNFLLSSLFGFFHKFLDFCIPIFLIPKFALVILQQIYYFTAIIFRKISFYPFQFLAQLVVCN